MLAVDGCNDVEITLGCTPQDVAMPASGPVTAELTGRAGRVLDAHICAKGEGDVNVVEGGRTVGAFHVPTSAIAHADAVPRAAPYRNAPWATLAGYPADVVARLSADDATLLVDTSLTVSGGDAVTVSRGIAWDAYTLSTAIAGDWTITLHAGEHDYMQPIHTSSVVADIAPIDGQPKALKVGSSRQLCFEALDDTARWVAGLPWSFGPDDHFENVALNNNPVDDSCATVKVVAAGTGTIAVTVPTKTVSFTWPIDP